MKILYLIPHVPYPLVKNTYQRSFSLAKELSKSYEIDLFCLDLEGGRKENVLPIFKEFCRRVHFQPFQRAKWAPFFWRMADPVPALIQHWHQRQLLPVLRDFVKGQDYDIIHFCDLILWQYVHALKLNGFRIIDRSRIDLMTQMEAYQQTPFSFKNMVAGMEGLIKMRAYEKRLLRHVDMTIVSSKEEKSFIHQELNRDATVNVLENGVDQNFFDRHRFPSSPEQYPTLLFCGTLANMANVHGLKWYFREIDPLVRKLIPSRKVWIVGLNPHKDILNMGMIEGVKIFPNVPDVRPYYQRAWLHMVPLKYGGATRLKLVESLCIGCPIVTTSQGMQGLDHLQEGKDILVANTPKAFAHSIERLIKNKEPRDHLIERGRRVVLENYTWEKLGKKISNWYGSLLAHV